MTFVYILLSLLVLTFLILFHELGHFAVGKLLGFRILGFSIGFGPAIFKFKKGETEYALRALPFGGSCQFDGEDEDAENDPKRFNANPVWKRFLVILAGPVTNVLLAIIIAFILMLCVRVPVYSIDEATGDIFPTIMQLTEDGPAANAGLQVGDIVLKVDDTSTLAADNEDSISALSRLIGEADSSMVFTVDRNGQLIEIAIDDAYNPSEGRNLVGITIGGTIIDYTHYNVGEAFTGSFRYIWDIIRLTREAICNMFTDGIHQGDVSGIVGAVAIMTDVAREGLVNLVYVAIILSLSLGIFNLIPFPALDGGRLLFLIIEAIKGKPLNRKVENAVNAIGLILLLMLMAVVTVFDVIGLFR